MKKDELIADIEQTIDWLTKSIDPETYNIIPFEGSWTAGQVVEHVNMAGRGFVDLLNGNTEVTTRPVNELIDRIKTMFLNFESKNISAAYLTPAMGNYNLQDQLAKLENIKSGIITAVNTLDLDMTCLDFDIPTFGHLTRLEAVYFFLFHTKRHVHQLQTIVKSLSKHQFQS
jgi:hypothetical protein